ncbi:HlyD family type I secretion periplasmic adaptor subunit [Hyphomonas jannaschiana]|uniref:Membrane fusion protein (MFP) family protein n=1 Tax=Hyphomonas jannaschiana VP2 TaxID=1280952 RepID=A0A059FC35_9PROT|nr:HlyD family type I secretion periplasmic adaptor subunit [Hyphomonas jannaschiana]KCZ88101.1 HlyD family type I secretion membrane fusion protein [Hyphomonas jannaschiana VP2]
MRSVPLSLSDSPADAEGDLQFRLKRILFGRTMIVLVVMLAGFLLWTIFAPLAGGAIASGQVVIDGERIPIQHQEGGLLDKISVREGDFVEQGQVLAVVKSKALTAKRNAATLNLFSLQVTEARLIAERDGEQNIAISADHIDEDLRGRAQDTIREAKDLLQKNNGLFETQMDTLSAQEAQTRSQLAGLLAQLQSLDEQITSLQDDMEAQRTLLEKGLTRLPAYRQYERQFAASKGQRKFTESEITRLEAALQEISSNRAAKMAEKNQRIASELTDTKSRITQAVEELSYLEDAFERSEIKSPIAGQVINVAYDAPGSIIPSGGQLMEIVPPDPKVVIEAHVAPKDVENLRAGNTAVLSFPGLSRREMPRITGRLTSLSDDVIVDPNAGKPYYLARVEVPFEDEHVSHALELVRPGMPVEVTLVTKSRTLAEYLIEPIAESYSKAFVSN